MRLRNDSFHSPRKDTQARILDFFSLWSPACAEGSVLSLFSFDKFKAEKKRKKIPAIKPLRLVMIRIAIGLTK